MNTPICSFTLDTDDSLFLETCEKLTQTQKLQLSEKKLYSLWRCAFKHFSYLRELCPNFCLNFGPNDVVDISRPRTSFYNLALEKINISLANFPRVLAHRSRRLLAHSMTSEEVSAFNAFINAMIQEEKRFYIEINR